MDASPVKPTRAGCPMPWAKDSLRVKTRILDPKVLEATVSGYLTLASSDEMRRQIVERMAQTGTLAVVLDLRGAVHVMSDEDWHKVVDTRDLAFPMPIPVAMIVSAADEEKVREIAAAMSGLGHLRGVFHELPPAAEWARRWAGNWMELPPSASKASSSSSCPSRQ